MRLSLAALAAVVVLALGGPARADTPKLEVTSAPVKAEVALGADIEVEVTVKNAGTEEAELTELTFDARSVSFELSCEGGRTAWDAQFHIDPPRSAMEPDPMTPIKREKLKAGESWKKTFTIPAIAAGAWSITAVYGGSTDTPRALGPLADPTRIVKVKEAAPKAVKVLAGPNGETDVVCKMTTGLGTFSIRFFPKEALGSAINFVRIAQKNMYDGAQFFRNHPKLQILQGGGADASAHHPWTIPLEQNLRHRPLMVAMARSQSTNSGGAQFYISYGPGTQNLDEAKPGYAVFAQVVKGKDVIESMAAVKAKGGPPPGDETIATPIGIESTRIQLAPKE